MLTSFEILALRKEHQHSKALEAARVLFKESPRDLWTVRTLAWCLYDSIVGCKNCSFSGAQDTASRSKLIREFMALPISSDDDVLLRKRSELSDPFAETISLARKDQEEGRIEKARARLAEALRKNPRHEKLNEAMAWLVWRLCLDEMKKEKPAPVTVQTLFREYAHLVLKKPSEIHSRILAAAARAARAEVFASFCGFCKWWDLSNLQDQDWIAQTNGGKTFDSLVEQVIKGIHKTLSGSPSQEVAHYCATFLLDNVGKYKQQEWFPYYAGEALLLLGRPDEARKRLLPILRSKNSEFWAWHTLARTYPVGDARRLSCLCKALSCPVKGPEFLLTVRGDLAKELVFQGYHDLAKYEIQQVIEVRQAHGWPIRGEVSEIQNSSWFASSRPREDKEAYVNWAKDAQEILAEDLPWSRAVLSVPKAFLGKEQKEGSIIDFAEGRVGLMSIPVKQKQFPQLANLPAGTALDARIDISGAIPRLVDLRQRSAAKWDILEISTALVKYSNTERGFSILLLIDGRTARAYHSDIPEAAKLCAGTFVGCRVVPDRDGSKVRNITGEVPQCSSIFWRPFNGEFISRDKGGGHVNDVFVPEYLSKGYQEGDSVSGLCAKTIDRITKKSWWEAVTAQKEI